MVVVVFFLLIKDREEKTVAAREVEEIWKIAEMVKIICTQELRVECYP